MRLSSRVRGLIITALIAGYGWMFHQPQASSTELLLVGAALQVIVLLLRRWVPADVQPQAMYVFELVADGITVLLFALGVFGGIVRAPDAL
ncbi:MAG TPA: hypothetical protein VFP37_03695 [Steroidobacteraceae bacterium]|nr:hypothetical protein [Steroidobacteraceae bacterium]